MEVVERFTAIGATVHTSTPEEFAAYIRTEYNRWGEVIHGRDKGRVGGRPAR